MIRLFAALEVPPEIVEDLAPRQAGLPGANWRPPESLHITLQFFGDVQERVAEDLDAELTRITGQPFDVALEGVGSFGEGHRLHAIWAGVRENQPLRVLAGRCESAARRAGLGLESRSYRPHVTLAYLRAGADQHNVASWIVDNSLLATPFWRVTWFGLYSSRRTAEGSRYELEREYPLF